jgi:hypothetical protein
MGNLGLAPRRGWELRSSGLLRSELWQLLTAVSGRPIGPILKVQEFKKQIGLIGCPETSVRNYHYTLRNSPEERSSEDNRRQASDFNSGS